MTHGQTRTVLAMLLGLTLAVLAGGCNSQPPTTLAPLPPSVLELNSRKLAAPDRSEAENSLMIVEEWAHEGSRPWKYIVIHHSASERGNAEIFDREHRARGFDELGYHFVIDNGNGGPDGRVEVGRRWRIQKWGAHAGGTPGNEYNNYGIGICLVGNFEDHMPSEKQLASLSRLVSCLVLRYDIPPECVIGHRDAPNATTACPGAKLHAYLHSAFRGQLLRLAERD